LSSSEREGRIEPTETAPSPAPVQRDAAARRRTRLEAAALGVFVVALAAARGVVRFGEDVRFDDEIGYISAGLALTVDGPPPASYSPLYAAWYALLSIFTTDVVVLFHLGWTALVGLILAAVAAALRAGGAGWVGTVVALASLSTLDLLKPRISNVGLLAAALLVLGLAAASRTRDVRVGLARMFLAASVGAFVRPELAAGAGAALVLHALTAARRRAPWRTVARDLAPGILACAVLAGAFGVPLAGGRSFLAFSQHYAANVVYGGTGKANPWEEHAAITAAAYGGAATVGEALVANPRAFAWHVGRNVAQLRSLRHLLAPSVDAEGARVVRRLLWAAVAAGLVLAVWRTRRHPALREAGGIIGASLAVAAAGSLAAMLVIRPEPSYALQLLVPIATAAAWGLSVQREGAAARPRRRALAALAAVAALALLPGPSGAPWWTGRKERPKPATDLVRLLQSLPVDNAAPLGVAGYWGLGAFARWTHRHVSYVDCMPFAACLRDGRVDVVVTDPSMREWYARHADRDFDGFRERPGGWGFVEEPLPGSSTAGFEVFVRASRLRGR
jgi:hypothetical protein